MKLRSNRKILESKLDELFSAYIRMRDKRKYGCCAFSQMRAHRPDLGNDIECCFHFVRKSRSKKLRWDDRNAVGACFACNGYMEQNEGPFWTWYARHYGVEQMEQLQRDSHGIAKFSIDDLRAMVADLQSKIETGARIMSGVVFGGKA